MSDLINGIDISVYQRARQNGSLLPFDPQAVAKAGFEFAIVRLGHGVTLDPCGADSVKQLRAAGLKCSGYWFLEKGPTAADQAEAFLANLEGVDFDFAPTLDVEEGDSTTAAKAIEWLETVSSTMQRKPMVYTMPEFSATHLASAPGITDYALWQATYTVAPKPMRCAPWPADSWVVWQWSDTGRVPGIATPCDLNRAKGLPQ